MREDFAETAEFVTEFFHLQDKRPLGPFSPALVAKIRGAGQVLGTPPEQIDNLLKHYGAQ